MFAERNQNFLMLDPGKPFMKNHRYIIDRGDKLFYKFLTVLLIIRRKKKKKIRHTRHHKLQLNSYEKMLQFKFVDLHVENNFV